MSELRLELKGLREEQARMTRIVADLHGEPMLEGMRNATLLVTRDAKRFAPVDTGRLRASITPEVRVSGPTTLQGVVGSNVEYAPYQELGVEPGPRSLGAKFAASYWHPGMKGKRFLQRAFENNIRRIVGYLDSAVQAIIRSNS